MSETETDKDCELETDINPDNWISNPDWCPWGSLIRFREDPTQGVANCKTLQFTDELFKKDSVAFLTKTHGHKTGPDGPFVAVLVLEEGTHMLYVPNFNQGIEVISRGTTTETETPE
jgi:hypothetical protein